MNKINNKSIVLGSKILSVLAFSLLIVPLQASAANDFLGGFGTGSSSSPYVYGSSSTYNSYYNGNSYYQAPYQTYQTPVYGPAPVAAPVIYSDETNSDTTSSTATQTAKVKTVSTKTSANSNAGSLAANAFYGVNSFLPSGLIQWVLFAIFILLIIILARTVFGVKESYHSTQLKHQ